MLAINFEDLEYRTKVQKKDCFYIWDYGKPDQILIEEFAESNIERTEEGNHYINKIVKRGAAKGIELATLDLLKESGVVSKRYDPVLDGSIRIEHEDITVRGRIDAISTTGIPICVRVIEGEEDVEKITKFIGQLGMMMYHLQVQEGVLILFNKQNGKYLFRGCEKSSNGIYTSESVTVNVIEQFKRFSKIRSGAK